MMKLESFSTTSPEQALKDKHLVEIFKPEDGTATSITVLLPDAAIPVHFYSSTYNTLLSCNQMVIAFKFLNPSPVFGQTRKQMAKHVRDVVRDYYAVDPDLVKGKYNIVGHGLGAKIALMVTSKYDTGNVGIVVSVDANASPKNKLDYSKADEVHLFKSEEIPNGCLPEIFRNKQKTSAPVQEKEGDKSKLNSTRTSSTLSTDTDEKDAASKTKTTTATGVCQ